MTPSTTALLEAGAPREVVPVQINYRIIELFSRGLYSSPHKALEELVSNSYDAMAQSVWLLLPSDLRNPTETMWVVDDGESMDQAGLHQLWRIAHSTKRKGESRDRPPIGKFGIGKLATYVLARQLTYVCRRDGRTLAITMDYDAIDQDSPTDTKLELRTRELTDEQTRAALASMSDIEGGQATIDLLCSTDGPATWTAAALSGLTPAVADIRIGRLRWLLSTALPKSPGFNLFLNGRAVVPSVDSRATVLTEWAVGENTSVPAGVLSGRDSDGPFVEIDGLKGKLRGTVAIYEDGLTKGKAAKWGHSHGFFVKVRGRLVNIDDPLFGLPALSHSAFSRFRLEVDADGLDEFLASTRESIIRRGPVELFQEWLRSEFNAARGIYDSWAARNKADVQLPARVGAVAASLSRRPLVSAVRALVNGDAGQLLLVQNPVLASDAEKAALVQDLEGSLETEAGPIRDVRLEAIGIDRYLAVYDPVAQIVRVNTLHPFFASFELSSSSHQTFEMLAVAEILTEAYIYDETQDSDLANAVIARRDAFLRDLVKGTGGGPASVAQYLLDQAGNPAGLPEAVGDALRSLGFQVSPTDGANRPDGLAVASVGAVNTADLEDHRHTYSLVFEAKAAVGRALSVADIQPTRLSTWRERAHANHALVVASQFDEVDSGARNDALETAGVTALTAADLALLVEVAAVKQLGFSKLENWLAECRTPEQSRAWIQDQIDAPAGAPILRDLLETIAEIQSFGPDPVEIPAVVALLRTRSAEQLDRSKVTELVRSLQSLAPGFVSFDGRMVVLESSLENVIREIGRQTAELPNSLLAHGRVDPLLADS